MPIILLLLFYLQHLFSRANGDIVYQSSSPDEEALVQAAAALNVKFVKRDFDSVGIYLLSSSFSFISLPPTLPNSPQLPPTPTWNLKLVRRYFNYPLSDSFLLLFPSLLSFPSFLNTLFFLSSRTRGSRQFRRV
jgi:magnesium-transporting ATPase (P-type)